MKQAIETVKLQLDQENESHIQRIRAQHSNEIDSVYEETRRKEEGFLLEMSEKNQQIEELQKAREELEQLIAESSKVIILFQTKGS